MKTILLFLFVLIGGTTVIAQPGFAISMEFKFYENRKLLDLQTLKTKYQLLDENNQNIIDSEAYGIRETPDKKNYIFTGGVVYNDLIRKFVVKNDTMTLYLKNHLKREKFQFTVDTLTFKKGKYLISDNQLSKIDYEKASQLYRESILKEVAFGKLNGNTFFYKYSGSSNTATDRVSIYADGNGNKKLLTTLPVNDNFIDIAEIIKIGDHFFIYLNLAYTSGDEKGRLFAIDLRTMGLSELNIPKSTYNIPDGYTYRNRFELLKDDKNAFSNVIKLKSEKDGKNYEAITPYSLKKNERNQYELAPLETTLYETQK